MLTRFKQHYNNLVKTFKNKTEWLMEEERIQELKQRIDKLVYIDLVYQDIHLHASLMKVVDDIYKISKKAKFKEKYIEEFHERLTYLKNWEIAYSDQVDSKLIEDNVGKLYELPEFTKVCIDKHLNLVLSKTVDYLPQEGNPKQLDGFLDMIDAYRKQLYDMADGDCFKWVYIFTDNNHYFPLRLITLNQFNRLGDRLEKGIDLQYENKYVKYINDRGYDIFGGWGHLQQHSITLEEVATVENNDVSKPQVIQVPETVIPKVKYNQLVNALYRHGFMFFLNDKFKITDPNHNEVLFHTLGVCLYYATGGKLLERKQFLQAIRDTRIMFNKTPKFRARRDRKYWLGDDMYEPLLKILNAFCKDRTLMISSLVATHTYDLCVPSDDNWKDVVKKHHDFVQRSHMEVYFPDNPFTEDEIAKILSNYENYLVPRYQLFTEKDKHHLFGITLDYWLNLRDIAHADLTYDVIKGRFSERHTTEENRKFIEKSWILYLFMSFHNKKYLLERFKNEPINIVSYGSSKEIYQTIVDLLENDLRDYELLQSSYKAKKVSIVTADNDFTTDKQTL